MHKEEDWAHSEFLHERLIEYLLIAAMNNLASTGYS